MAALDDAPALPFLCINVATSAERLAWQRTQCAALNIAVVPVAAAAARARTPNIHACNNPLSGWHVHGSSSGKVKYSV